MFRDFRDRGKDAGVEGKGAGIGRRRTAETDEGDAGSEALAESQSPLPQSQPPAQPAQQPEPSSAPPQDTSTSTKSSTNSRPSQPPSKTQLAKQRKRHAKAVITIEHVDIIKDAFWEERPWILGTLA